MNYLSEKSGFTFARKFTIKNLFNAKDTFAQFSDLHFLSFKAFTKFMQAQLFTTTNIVRQNFHIDIISREELEAVLHIDDIIGAAERFYETHDSKFSFSKEVILTLHFEVSLLDDVTELVTDQKIELSVKPETIKHIINNKVVFPTITPCWVEYVFDANNYAKQYEELIKLWLTEPHYQLVDLQFDYLSFENKPISEFHKLYFYMNMLRIWTKNTIGQTNECCNTTMNGAIIKRSSNALTFRTRSSPLRCYIDEDLNIRLNKNEIYFPMDQYLDKNGEEISIRDLNKIRKIIDVKFNDTLISNQYLIDLDQNYKIMGDYYQIPYTTQLISEWLGLTIPISTLTKHAHTLSNIKKII